MGFRLVAVNESEDISEPTVNRRGVRVWTDPRYRRWLLFSVLALTFLLVNIYRLSTAVIVEPLMATFRITGAELGVIHAMFFFIYAIMQIPTGVLVDRIGPRKTAASGAIVMNVGAVWFTLAAAYGSALGARFLIGLGGSVIFVSMLRFAANWYDPAEFSTMNGVCFAVGGIGGILATTPFAYAVSIAGWERAIQTFAVIGLGIAILTVVVVRDTPAAAGFDPTFGGGAGAPLTITEIRDQIGFVLRDPWVIVASVILFSGSGIYLTIIGLWGIPFIVQVYDTSVGFASLFTLIGGAGMVIGPPTIGWFAGRFGRRPQIVILGGGVYTCALGLIAFMGEPPLFVVAIAYLLIGIFLGAFVVTYPLVKERHPLRASGIALGTINGAAFFGASVIPTVMGYILDEYWTGEIVRGARVYTQTGYRVAFGLAALAAATTILGGLWLHYHVRKADDITYG